jgi:RNA polymerase sigma-70 factor (ECF subfamily)
VSDPVNAVIADQNAAQADSSSRRLTPDDEPGERATIEVTVEPSDSRGDPDFDDLFRAHYDRLVRSLTVIAGNAESAGDAVQEAFVKAHLKWRRISKYDDPIGWVRRVAINQLRDEHRRSGRKRTVLTRLSRGQENSVSTPEIDEFDRLLTVLPKQQRAVTALFYVEGLSIDEIGVALGIAAGTVKSHLHDARNRLRPVLERESMLRDGDRTSDREGGPSHA